MTEEHTVREKGGVEIPKTPLRFLLFVSATYKRAWFFAILTVVLASGISQFSSYFFKLIIDASESGRSGDVLMFALLFPVAMFSEYVFFRASGFIGGHIAAAMKKRTNDLLVSYVFLHSHGYFSNRFAGSLLSKIGNVVGAIDQFVPDFLWTHLYAFVTFSVTFVFIVRADVLSGILFGVLVFVLIGVNRLFHRRKKEIAYRTSELGTKLRGVEVDIISNIAATRQYVRTNDEIARVEHASEEHRVWSKKNWYFTEIMLSVNSLILFVFTLAIFYFIVMRWGSGGISTGSFVFVLALYTRISVTLLFIGRAFNNTARTFGEIAEGLDEILVPYEIRDVPDADELKEHDGIIEWNDVTFQYGDNTVFDAFNLTIKSGERIGLVGQSGAGKTTFVSLMLREHDLTSGSISIDGQDIAEVTQDSLREHIAVVPQEPMLFHRSIRENISYGKPDATNEEIIDVAKKAEAHDFIASLSEGYETLVGERGIKLAGGQKQRIAIARAMLKNAPILILDEATSALDSESEVAIQKALHTLMEGKTVIAIAHRLSTLREMDRIVVLEKGKIVEDGTHISLTKKRGGIYARLWKHQAGGFLVE